MLVVGKLQFLDSSPQKLAKQTPPGRFRAGFLVSRRMRSIFGAMILMRMRSILGAIIDLICNVEP